ncbi:MAG: hypothetical protein Kow0065_06140 [Methylomicrobium sp.]
MILQMQLLSRIKCSKFANHGLETVRSKEIFKPVLFTAHRANSASNHQNGVILGLMTHRNRGL